MRILWRAAFCIIAYGFAGDELRDDTAFERYDALMPDTAAAASRWPHTHSAIYFYTASLGFWDNTYSSHFSCCFLFKCSLLIFRDYFAFDVAGQWHFTFHQIFRREIVV